MSVLLGRRRRRYQIVQNNPKIVSKISRIDPAWMNERIPKRIPRHRRKQKRYIRPTTQRSPVPDDFRCCGERRRRSLTLQNKLRCPPAVQRSDAFLAQGILQPDAVASVPALSMKLPQSVNQRGRKQDEWKAQGVKGKNCITPESKHSTQRQILNRYRTY